MRRIAVWFDGTKDAASVLADARRLTGLDGELILILDPEEVADQQPTAMREGQKHVLESRARLAALPTEGIPVRVLERRGMVAKGLDSVLRECGADMLACSAGEADHVGSSAWKGAIGRALAQSPVPTLVCPSTGRRTSSDAPPRLLVPLDGSTFAETVLPLAETLAREWNAPLWLAQVTALDSPWQEIPKAREYLLERGKELDCETQVHVVTGRSIATMLVQSIRDWMITDVVMASHGWTGSPDAVVGSVAERVIEHLPCRLIVVSPAAVRSVPQKRSRNAVPTPLGS